VLLLVYNATRVQLCWRAGPPVELRRMPATGCTHARLLTRLPRSYPVQRNLLDLFHDSVWETRLPPGAGSHGERTAYVTAFGYRHFPSRFGEFTVTW
jgi:hypothetical protein